MMRHRRIEYRNFRRTQRDVARRQLDRECHGAVVQIATRELPANHAGHWADLRRGRRRVYGGLLRVLDTLIGQGRRDLALTVTQALTHYVEDDVIALHPHHDTGEHPRAA